MEKLKPCPWCGCKPTVFMVTACLWRVYCKSSRCQMAPVSEFKISKEEAIKAWNTRKEAA